MTELVIQVNGLRICSEMNAREHWAKRAKRAKYQRELVTVALLAAGSDVREKLSSAGKIVVTFTRRGGKRMDSDNAYIGFKHVRDAVAKWLRRDDADGTGVEWAFPVVQIPGRGEHSVTISIKAE